MEKLSNPGKEAQAMRRFLCALALAALVVPAARADVKYTLNGSNTHIHFIGSKADGSKHEGGFKVLAGSAASDKNGLVIDVEIDMDSLYSDNILLTKHLKSPDFFGVKAHPKARFVSTKISHGEADTYQITGQLSLCGKSEQVIFPAKITLTKDLMTLAAEFKINRNDIGITYNKGSGKDKIDDFVVIKVLINATKPVINAKK